MTGQLEKQPFLTEVSFLTADPIRGLLSYPGNAILLLVCKYHAIENTSALASGGDGVNVVWQFTVNQRTMLLSWI